MDDLQADLGLVVDDEPVNPPLVVNEEPDHSQQVTTYKVYKRRWYILMLFSLLACLQCLVWNTFGPIDRSIKYAYNWSDATVAMMANWGTIMFVLTVAPLCWLLETKHLRVTTLTVSFFVALGTVLRVISTNDTVFLVSAHLGAILNGIAGVTIMAAPPAISAVWFPPKQRTTATCINQVFNQLGNGVAFTLGPYLVPDNNLNSTESTDRQAVKNETRWYMGLDATVGVLLFVAFLAYFPKGPPSPPSASSTVPRTNFKQGIKDLCKNKNVWLCTFGYSVAGGINGAWQAVMTVNFAPLGVNDEESGRIGLVTCFVCCLIAVAVAYFTDHIRKHIKITLMILLVLASCCFIWLTLLCDKIIPFRLWQLYVSTVCGVSFTFAQAPLFFEYTVELSYPAPEGLVGGFLTGFNNLVGFVFLGIFFVPNIGTVWMNYALVAASIVSIPAVALTKEAYRRLDVDVPSSSTTSQSGDDNESSSSNNPYAMLDNS